MQKIIPDTNFLVYLAKYRMFDSLLDYDFIIIKQVIDELKKIGSDTKTKMKDRQAAIVALEFLRSQKLRIMKQEGKTDSAILILAKKLDVAIATMDKQMIREAKKQKIKVIKLIQKKYFR